MNYRYVTHELGKLLVLVSGVMGVLAVMAGLIDAIERQRMDFRAEGALLISGAVCVAVGGLAWLLTRRCKRYLGRREAMLLVAMSWILGALFAGLPFFVWAHLFLEAGIDHPFRSFENCYFEAMSGLTTTGATVLADVESVPRELLLWRSFTHWLGGLGIVVLFVAVLPSLGLGGKKLFQVEAPGPAPEGLQPQIRQTARILWLIYLALTAIEIIALSIAGMHVFDAVCHTFSTVATGGLSTKNSSIGYYYNKPAVDIIVIVVMVLAGANFGLYYQIWRRRLDLVWKDTELRLYLAILLFGSLLVTAAIANSPRPLVLTTGAEVDATVAESFRQGIFTTVSIQTTTGFCTSDYNNWPFLGHAVLVTLMFVGGCSGSTAGGIKVIRVWITTKVMLAQVERFVRPNVTRPVRVSGDTVDRQLQLGSVVYVLGMVVLFAVGWCAIMVLEQWNVDATCTSTTAATASVATLCTIGPGLAGVGPVENYGWFTAPSKMVMCGLMALGRLEIFAVVVLFTPRFWHRE